MEIKNNFLVIIFFGLFLNSGIAIAMDQPIPAQETLRPIDKALLYACKSKKSLDYALSRGANPNIFDQEGHPSAPGIVGFTPLLYVCLFGDLSKIKQLLDYGADVNLKSKSGISPLYLIFSSRVGDAEKRYELASFLVQRGANVNLNGPENHSVLQAAIQTRSDKFVSLLLKEGKVNLNSVDTHNLNALNEALMNGDEVLVHKLFELGCKPTIDIQGASLMHHAAQRIDMFFKGNIEILDFLHQKGLDVNAVDKYGQTPLHWASEAASYNVVKKLLDLGADPRIKDDNKKTAFDLSVDNPYKTVRMLLKDAKEPIGIPQAIREEKPADVKTATEQLPKKKVKKRDKAKRKLARAQKVVKGVFNTEKREESAQKLMKSYAEIAAGTPARRTEQPQPKMITFEDDNVEVMIPIMRKVSLENPLVELTYSDHVKETMARKHDYFHSFSPDIEQTFGKFANAEIMKPATRHHTARVRYTLPATVKMFGKKEYPGVFEFVVKDKKMEHRFFKPDKRKKDFTQKNKAPLLLREAPKKSNASDVGQS